MTGKSVDGCVFEGANTLTVFCRTVEETCFEYQAKNRPKDARSIKSVRNLKDANNKQTISVEKELGEKYNWNIVENTSKFNSTFSKVSKPKVGWLRRDLLVHV